MPRAKVEHAVFYPDTEGPEPPGIWYYEVAAVMGMVVTVLRMVVPGRPDQGGRGRGQEVGGAARGCAGARGCRHLRGRGRGGEQGRAAPPAPLRAGRARPRRRPRDAPRQPGHRLPLGLPRGRPPAQLRRAHHLPGV